MSVLNAALNLAASIGPLMSKKSSVSSGVLAFDQQQSGESKLQFRSGLSDGGSLACSCGAHGSPVASLPSASKSGSAHKSCNRTDSPMHPSTPRLHPTFLAIHCGDHRPAVGRQRLRNRCHPLHRRPLHCHRRPYRLCIRAPRERRPVPQSHRTRVIDASSPCFRVLL